jgi:glutaminyl-peptide cyclotransferase
MTLKPIARLGQMLKTLMLGSLLGLAACSGQLDAIGDTISARLAPVEQLQVQVLESYPHDPDSYTQGLLLHEGYFYESAGQRGKSDVRMVQPQTGEVLRKVEIPAPYFAEGLALVGEYLVQITWQENLAFIYRLSDFVAVGAFSYLGEGWGLCYDGQWLYMSDGSQFLSRRDPQTFALLERLTVTQVGQPVPLLNELECVGDSIYANIWFTDSIVRIDKATGIVTASISAAGLLDRQTKQNLPSSGVLNGIAHDPAEDVFYITGKLWPRLFKVRFVPANGQ